MAAFLFVSTFNPRRCCCGEMYFQILGVFDEEFVYTARLLSFLRGYWRGIRWPLLISPWFTYRVHNDSHTRNIEAALDFVFIDCQSDVEESEICTRRIWGGSP